LNRWIQEFYPGQQRAIQRIMLPIVASYAQNIAGDAADEVGSAAPDIDAFAGHYTESLAVREAGSSIGQLRALMATTERDALQETLSTRLTEWSATRPGKVAAEEVVRVAAGAARFTWQQSGVTYLVWRAHPGACELCQQMDGRRVKADGYFLGAGDSVGADGKAPISVDFDLAGPPLHQGCECDLVPGR
jgi:hypothetical protein